MLFFMARQTAEILFWDWANSNRVRDTFSEIELLIRSSMYFFWKRDPCLDLGIAGYFLYVAGYFLYVAEYFLYVAGYFLYIEGYFFSDALNMQLAYGGKRFGKNR